MRTLLFLFLIVNLLLVNLGWSLTLNELIELGLSRNPAITAAEYERVSAEEGISSARSAFLPQIELSSIYSRTMEVPMLNVGFGQQMPLGYYNNYQNSLSLTLPVFTGTLRKIGYESAIVGHKLKELSKEKQELNVESNIALAYYGYKLSEANLLVAKEDTARVAKHLESVNEQFASGFKSQLDVLNAQLMLERSNYTLLEAEKNLFESMKEGGFTSEGIMDLYGFNKTSEYLWKEAEDIIR